MTKDTYHRAADEVARDFLGRGVIDFEVSVARNAILDCLRVAEDPDFIRRSCAGEPRDRCDLLNQEIARRVVRAMAPRLVELTGRAYERQRELLREETSR
jgi:hypothetical protein